MIFGHPMSSALQTAWNKFIHDHTYTPFKMIYSWLKCTVCHFCCYVEQCTTLYKNGNKRLDMRSLMTSWSSVKRVKNLSDVTQAEVVKDEIMYNVYQFYSYYSDRPANETHLCLEQRWAVWRHVYVEMLHILSSGVTYWIWFRWSENMYM